MDTNGQVPDSGQAHDSELMRLASSGDATAFKSLYDRYGGPAYSIARRILFDDHLAQEAVQEVFLSLWRNADRFEPGRGAVSTYILSMTHHRAVDVVRRESRRGDGRVSDEHLNLEPDPKADVESEIVSMGLGDEVRSALAELPSTQREALNLAYFGGYTQVEVARLINVPLGTVKTRMAAGMRRLRVLLAASHGQIGEFS